METKEEKNKDIDPEPIDSLQLKKAYTFFIIPFYYEGNDYIVSKENNSSEDTIWEKAKQKILNEDDDVLYPYIINFIQGQISDPANQHDHLDIYNINSNPKSTTRKFWDAFTKKPIIEDDTNNNQQEIQKPASLHSTEIEIGKDNNNKALLKSTDFDLQRDNNYAGFKSPHLFISPSANIGILTFCIGLGKNSRTIDDMKRFNYFIHKINKPLNKCTTQSFQLSKGQTFYNEQAKVAQENKIIGYRKNIAPHDEAKTPNSPYNEFSWNIRTLINMLLADVKGLKQEDGSVRECDVKLFSNTRAHLFSFCQIDGVHSEFGFDDVKLDLMRLCRCVNDKYILPTDEATENEMCTKTFDNIYFSSSVEGAAMIAVATKDNEEFVKQIDNQGLPRYLAIYLLVMIQRYSMLHINRRLTERSTNTSDTALWNILNIIKKVKVHCYYTDVSPFYQHNQFYQHCNKNLHIRETFNEIDNKTKILNLTITHDMQELLEEQKKTIEQQRTEDKRSERERQELEKERDRKLRIAEQKAESGQRRLNIVVGVLTIFQVAGVIYEFTKETCLKWLAVFFTFAISLFFLYLVMNWEKDDNLLIKWVRKIYYRGKQ